MSGADAATRRVPYAPVRLAVWSKGAEWLTLAGVLAVLPRMLGPEDYGTFGFALGLVTIGSTGLALSGPSVMARFVAAAPTHERAALARGIALHAVRWRTAGVALVTLIAIAASAAYPSRLPPRLTLVVVIGLVLDAAATLVFQIALGLDQQVAFVARYPLQNLTLLVATPLLYALAGPTGALAAIAVSAAVALVFGLVVLRGHWTGAVAPVPAAATRFALLQAANGFMVQVLLRGSVIAAALLASRSEAGYAALAVAIAIAITNGVWQVFSLALPSLAEVARDDEGAAADMLVHLATRLSTLVLPGSVAAAMMAGPALALLAGSRYSGAHGALVTTMATVPLALLNGIVSTAATVRLRPDTRLWSTGIGAACLVVAAPVLAPRFGAEGAGGSLLVGTFASAMVGWALFPDELPRRLGLWALGTSVVIILLGLWR